MTDDQRRIILAFGLTMLLLAGYQWFFAPPAPPVSPPPETDAPLAQPAADAPQEPATRPAAEASPDAGETGEAGAVTSIGAEAGEAARPAEPARVVARNVLDLPGFEIELADNAVTRWQLRDHREEPAREGAPIDLCAGSGERCLRWGFRGLGAPDRVNAVGSPVEAIRAEWDTPEAKLSATLRPRGEYQVQIGFSVDSARGEVIAHPWVELAAELDTGSRSYVFEGLRFRRAGSVESIAPGKLAARHDWEGRFEWIMWDEKYFGRAILPRDGEIRVQVESSLPEKGIGPAVIRAELAPLRARPDAIAETELAVFGGPKQIGLLKRVGRGLQESIDFGFTGVLGRPILALLQVLNGLVGNYGWAIILLTILIKIVTYPLTRTSFRSMQAMTKLRPKMEELQKKHKQDPQRLNQEMIALYRTEKVNPLGGCLPILIQIPVFFALYKVLLVSIELRHAPWLLWVHDLAAPETLIAFAVAGFDVPIRLLPLLMGASMLLQQKLTPTSVDPIQQKVFMLLPILFTFMLYAFPSGLVLYWLTNNLVSISQQWWMLRGTRSAEAGKAK